MKTLNRFFYAMYKNPSVLLGVAMAGLVSGCGASATQSSTEVNAPIKIPVLEVKALPASTYHDIPATLEGRVNVEIRPQVDGYLEKIYVDEGSYVSQGEPLFKLNDLPYREHLHNAQANLLAAQANLEKAKLEVERLEPLVQNKVVSDIQLKTAQAGYQTAKAQVAQAQAMVSSAKINLGYTLITAPVSGYLGRIPYKSGSLVGRSEPQPLTVLSDIQEIYAYFAMSEMEFLQFKEQFPGKTIKEKLANIPPVHLVLPDNNLYTEAGKIETLEGQFNKAMGTISFRASFPNPGGLLRSGNTGKVRISTQYESALVVPKEATFEMQDKVLVFAVADSNKVVSRPVQIADQRGTYYFIEKGVKPGEQIVLTGHSRLHDGAAIKPQPVSMDSLLQVAPL